MEPIFSPSLMNIDYLHVQRDLEVLCENFTMLHADIMDGYFAKNITLSPGFVNAVKSVASIPVEAHLMVTYPEDYIDALAGVDYITLHVETINTNAFRLINKIKNMGSKLGLALNPATPLCAAEHLLKEADLLNIMGVDIGYSGQQFIEPMLNKIAEAKKLKDKMGYSYILQVDGGCAANTYKKLWQHGTECFVLGAALFRRSKDLSQACKLVKDDLNRESPKGLLSPS